MAESAKEFDHIPAPNSLHHKLSDASKNAATSTECSQQKWLPSRVLFISMNRRISLLLLKKALELGGYKEDQTFTGINGGTQVTTGFGHSATCPCRIR